MIQRRYLAFALLVALSQLAACAFQRASPWKVQGGPKECMEICKGWDLEFAGMVGVGDQTRTTEGASACVCQVRKSAPTAELLGTAAAAASMAAPITAAQEAAATAAEAGGP